MKFRWTGRPSARHVWSEKQRLRKPLITDLHSNVSDTLHTLSGDLDVLGWDLPGRLYFLVDDAIDPSCRLVGAMPTYPPRDMQAAYDEGFRVPEDVHGLVVAGEGYRHLTFEEVLERNAGMLERIRQGVEANLGEKVDEERVHEECSKHYYQSMLPKLPSPGQMPSFMRAETRTVCAVLRDGTTFSHHVTRGKNDAQCDIIAKDQLGQQNIPSAMYMFLHGLRPEPDIDDPCRAVADMETLNALSGLPTLDK